MRTVVPDPPPAEFAELLERRRRLGLDRRDEVWKGVLHMGPAPWHRHADIAQQLAEILGPLARTAGFQPTMHEFNIGEADDYRIPDGGLHRDSSDVLYHPTAALVVEIISPGDETRDKIPFYAEHNVDELLMVDPQQRTVEWLGDPDTGYRPIERSRLIDLSARALERQLRWPPAPDA
jgi:Uma2 family endonuclease